MDRLIKILKEIDFQFAYHHFAEGKDLKPPFICYHFPSSNNFSADNIAYYKKTGVQIELYTRKKDIKAEEKVEKVIDENNIFYNKSNAYIDTEDLFYTVYNFEMEE